MNRRGVLVGIWLIACMLLVSQAGRTQPTRDEFNTLLQEIEALKAGQKAIHNDVQAIKKLLSARGAERPPIRDIAATIHVADAFVKGDKRAPLTLLEFTDYQ